MKELLLRALKTFVQAAAGYVTANCVVYLSGGEMSGGALKNAFYALICAAAASGLCAVMNMRCIKKCADPTCDSCSGGEAVLVGDAEVSVCCEGESDKKFEVAEIDESGIAFEVVTGDEKDKSLEVVEDGERDKSGENYEPGESDEKEENYGRDIRY